MADDAAEPIEHDSPDAQILVLRTENGGMETVPDTPDARETHRAGALKRRAEFEHRIAGSKARAGHLPRLLTAPMAAAATNLMLMKIVQEELVPASAKEAADVAKITHAIFREASGQTAGNLNLTPGERASRMGEIDALEKALKERAKTATEHLGGAPAEGEEVPDPPEPTDEWEHEADPVG